MSKTKDYPSAQPFNVSARRCQSKKNAWFQHAPFHNNGSSKKKKNSED